MMLVSLAVLITSFTVSYARSRGEALGVFGSEGLMQRADRLTVLGIALAFSPFFGHRAEGFVAHPFYAITAGSLCLLAVLSTTTAFTRIMWTLNQLKPDVPASSGPAQEQFGRPLEKPQRQRDHVRDSAIQKTRSGFR